MLRHVDGRQGVVVREWAGSRSPTPKDGRPSPTERVAGGPRQGPTALGDTSGKEAGGALLLQIGQGFSKGPHGGHDPAGLDASSALCVRSEFPQVGSHPATCSMGPSTSEPPFPRH